jgi:competence protein ComEC
MNPWRPLPLLRLVIPFIAGIVAGLSTGYCFLPAFFFILTFSACFLLVLINLTGLRFSLRWLAGSLILISLFVCGLERALETEREAVQPPAITFVQAEIFLVRVIESPVVKQGSIRCEVDVIAVRRNGDWNQVKSRFMLRVYEPSELSCLRFGRFYLVRGRPEPLIFFNNPHAFNYSRYLYSQGVRYQLECSKAECCQVVKRDSYGICALAMDIRDYLLKIFKDKGLSGQEFSVASALLLGYVNDIDNKLRSAFAASGTMHILSVSGMHVGIIFIFLETILSFLKKIRYGTTVKCLTEILFIWSYAAITGFSPAVLRAATTLSFLITGKTIKRKPEMLNILSASVFFLLIMNPALLADVGFQLSYLAVIGIVLLYKPIYDLYVTHLWLPDKIWALIAVSAAAQIATFPLSMFYFHQFPNYFILSNLLIVPFSNGIIFLGIISLLLSPLPFAGRLSVTALRILVSWLNACVLWIEHLPGSVSRGFFPGILDVLLIYLLIIAICFFLIKKRPVFLVPALAILVILEGFAIADKLNTTERYSIAIHKGSQGFVIRILKGRKELCLYSGIGMMNDKFTGEQIRNERLAEKIKQVYIRWIRISGRQGLTGFEEVGRWGGMLVVKGHKIWLLERDISSGFSSEIHADIVLISGNVPVRMTSVKRIFMPGIVLNVSTSSHRKVLKWTDEAKHLKMNFYDLKTSGFYQEEI